MPTESELIQTLEDSIAAGPDGAIALLDGDTCEVVPLSGIRKAFLFHLASPSLFQEIIAATAGIESSTLNTWTRVAAMSSRNGVILRQGGDIAAAYLRYRFALAVACRARNPQGMEAISANVYQLREFLRDVAERGIIPAANLVPEPNEEWATRFRNLCEDLRARLREDAQFLLPWALELADSEPLMPTKMLTLLAARRLAACAGNAEERRRLLGSIVEMATPTNLELIAVLEELADTQSGDFPVLLDPMFGLKDTSDPGPEQRAFEVTWKAYERLSTNLADIPLDIPLEMAFRNAFQHLENLRVATMMRGGPMAHSWSLAASRYLQVVGRDYVLVLTAAGSKYSLDAAERLKARALGDMMARSHYVALSGLPRQFQSRIKNPTGNVQSMEPCGLEEIARCAKSLDAVVIYYLKCGTDFFVWLIRPDGTMNGVRIPIPVPLLDALFRSLPYPESASRLREGRGLRDMTGFSGEPAVKNQLNEILASLYDHLLPPALQAMLPPGVPRLTILPDGPLDYLPFCALRGPDGKYLVERYEILYLPSMTAWLATESDLIARQMLTERDGPIPFYRGGNLMRLGDRVMVGEEKRRPSVYGPGSLVLGDPTLSPDYTLNEPQGPVPVHLPDLPGAVREAREVSRLLGGAKLCLHSEATRHELVEQGAFARVIHLAAHGVVDAARPEGSFLALADSPLTAADLYYTGFGFGLNREMHAGLVMMSACETGLGAFHPDSVVSLANGFLITGANSVGSTLWRVHDDTTSDLMIRFYQLLTDPKGASLSACLRESQLEMLRNEEKSNPVFWAAFKITGSHRNPLTADRRDSEGGGST